MIELKHINKYYNKNKNNEIHVINDVSFTLKNQGFVTLFGVSGSGKTTLLNVIGGLDKAHGEIIYDNQSFKNYPSKKIDAYRKNNIGYVFQNYNLINELSVYDNLKLALEVIGISDEDEVKKRIEYCLKMVGLYKFRKKPAFALSGGQMQRVSIARALIKHSKIIIADEPTGNLDSENSIEIMEILKKISKTSLVLLVTHNQSLAEFYSDEIIEIKDGSVINHRQSSQDASLKQIHSENNVYLKDLYKHEQNNGKIHYQLYTENENCEPIELQLIQKNNQFILKSNCKITLIENSVVKLIDDHYKEIKKEEYKENFNYDTSWYNNQTHKKPFKNFFKSIILSFKSFSNKGKRQSFFQFALALIGVIIAFLNISLVSYSNINEDNLLYDQQLYGITNQFDFYSENLYQQSLKNAIQEDLVENIYQVNNSYEDLLIYFSTFDIQNVSFETIVLDDELIDDFPLLAGRKSTQENEFVLSQFVADQILKQVSHKNLNYDTLINLTIDNKVIVGVVQYNSHAVYHHLNEKQTSISLFWDKDDNPIYGCNKTSIPYQITSGKDISNHFEGIVNDNSSIQIGETINDVLIVGKYNSENLGDETQILIDSLTLKYFLYSKLGNNIYFKTNQLAKLQNCFALNGFEVDNMYQITKNFVQKNNQSSKRILIPVIIIL